MDNTPWYTDESNFWRFRAIFHPTGLDFVPDRGGFAKDARTDGRVEFIKDILDSAGFKRWVALQDSVSDDVFEYNHKGMHFRATNNRSYGYTYLWAWEDTAKKKVKVYEFDLIVDGRRVDSVQIDENNPEHAMSTFLNEFCWEGKIHEHQTAHVELVNEFEEEVDEDSYSPEIHGGRVSNE